MKCSEEAESTAISQRSWSSVTSELTFDESYEGDQLVPTIDDVLDILGLELVPSVEAGQGILELYDDLHTDPIVSYYDFATYCYEVQELAYSSSSESEFRNKLKQYFKNLVS